MSQCPLRKLGSRILLWEVGNNPLVQSVSSIGCLLLSFCLHSVFKMGTEILDQQVGCLWQGDNIVTVSLSGAINFLDKNNPDTPKQVLWVGEHNSILSTKLIELHLYRDATLPFLGIPIFSHKFRKFPFFFQIFKYCQNKHCNQLLR